MAILPEDFVLRQEHSVDTSHQTSTFTVQIAVDFLLKGGLVKISGSDGDTQCHSLFFGLTGNVLEDRDGGVDASAFLEEGSDGTAGTFGGDEDDVDVGGDFDLGPTLSRID